MTEIHAVPKSNVGTNANRIPVPLSPDDIWFYDNEMSKIIPDIDPDWITVVFRTLQVDKDDEEFFSEAARTILIEYDALIDFFYDVNLAQNTCFFKLLEGTSQKMIWEIIRDLNSNEHVQYTHPTLRIKEKTFAFFDAFEVIFKTGVPDEQKKRLFKQLHVSVDSQENMYKVDLFQISFFTVINLLAEDVNVSKVVPHLVELKPSIRTTLTLPINGGNIGDPIPFVLMLSFSERINIEPGSLVNINIKPGEISRDLFDVTFDPYDYVRAVSESPVYITGSMTFYAPGEFIIPPIPIRYTCVDCAEQNVKTIKTNSIMFKVSSLVPSQSRESTLIIPMDNMSPDYRIEFYHREATIHLTTCILSFFIALVCLGFCLFTAMKAKRQQKQSQNEKKEEILLERLQSQLRTTPPDSHWMYVVELNRILREYVATKYRLTLDPLGGSGETFFESINHKLPAESAPGLLMLLKEIDTIVALESEHYPDLERFKADVKQIISSLLDSE